MVREIVHDPLFLSRKSEKASEKDLLVAKDLLETLQAHKDGCVGMAANMIGELKSIIVFENNGTYETMLNPRILKKEGQYRTREGCLSLSGERETIRYSKIKVQYETPEMKTRIKSYSGFTAEIIQHEIDHINGILI